MAENKDILIQVKKIPAFTVLKNNSIIKNIILLRKPPPFDDASSINQDSDEEILLVGRHPHCNITLEHPSISRYHLRIHSNPSSHMLSVIDLSSVHGTWVSGKRIEPGVHVNLKEGDTVKLGGSSRIYKLHWVPLTQAFDVGDPFMPTVYTIKEGEEETNQDEKPEAHSSDNDLKCLNLSSSDKIHRSPLKRSNPLASPASLISSFDDTDGKLLRSSKTDSENGEIFSTVLGRLPVFSGTISATKDSDTPHKSDNQSSDNMCNKFEKQNQGIVKDDLFSVPSCSQSSSDDMWVEHSRPSKTGHEDDEICTNTETLSQTEDLSNWLRDNMSDDFELHNHGVVKDDLFSEPNCSKSSRDDVWVEHSSPSKTGQENGEISTTTEDISLPEDPSNASRDDMSDDLELQNNGIVKDDLFSEPNCSKSSSDGVWVEHSSPSKTVHENGEISTTTEAISESEDMSNASRDNMSDELEQLGHTTTKVDLVTVPDCSNSSCDNAKVEHLSLLKKGHEIDENSATTEATSESEDLSNWSRDNMSDEFEQLGHAAMKVDLVSVPNCSNSSCDNAKVEHLIPLKTGQEIDENSTTIEAASESEDQSKCSRDNMNDEFEQLSHRTSEYDLVSAALYDALETHEKDALRQFVEKSNEVEMCTANEPVNQQKMDRGSFPVSLINGVNRDEGGSFMPDRAGNKEVTVGFEFEQIKQMKMLDAFSLSVVVDGVDNKVDHDNDITEKESASVALPDGTDMHQDRDLTPDISRAEEVHMNLEPMKNASVSTTLINSSYGNELEIFTPDKENKNPNAKSLKKQWKEDELKNSINQTMSKKTIIPAISEEQSNFGFSKNLLKSLDESNSDEEKFVSDSLLQRSLNMIEEIYPYHRELEFTTSEKETKSRLMIMEGSRSSINYPQTVPKTINSSLNFEGGAKKLWTMVVDTNSLLNDESLKHLKLLQGLKGTRLYVPKIVMRELVNIKCHHGHVLLAKITKKASLALKWIDECMVDTRWWIHVDDEILDSSEVESEVLKTALHLRKEVTYRKTVILSNDLTLKIKAMAEGVMCEAADEFRRSLVNPFSERFMWVGSLPTGPTWSCIDDDILRRKYHGCGLKASHGLEGLRLLTRITTFR